MAYGFTRIVRRGLLAIPFLAIGHICTLMMNPDKMESTRLPMMNTGRISWDGGSIPILDTFYHNDFLDSTWKHLTVLFSPSALGYDPVSWWAGLSFSQNLGTLYAIWMVDSHRDGNKSSPASLPVIFTLFGNLIGAGTAGPWFFFLCFTFGNNWMTEKEKKPSTAATRGLNDTGARFMLPIMLLFHTFEISMGYFASTPETRHFFTWTWEFLPLWAGLTDALLSRLLRRARNSSSPSSSSSGLGCLVLKAHRIMPQIEIQVVFMALISGVTWAWMVFFAPYSLGEILLPPKVAHGSRWFDQEGLIAHSRLVMQVDNLCTFGASFLALGFELADLYAAGLLKSGTIFEMAAVFPIVVAMLGPGAGLVFAWIWKERHMKVPVE
ncbi:hypothetical protein QBC35DRAFT_29347 [Podospora australis]|uniref:Uncharacterized protein n=1 Tax=Podospora australis TaxID=1536484 RepID=A0AAN6WNJ5_9PEZI|nr:hypothetical protein QBC35DRAFT_29347 [Podospora australis]